MNKGLGRVVNEDKRDQDYPLKGFVKTESPLISRYWPEDVWWGDQGDRPHCVAFAWLHWLADGPVTHRSAGPIYRPRDIYAEAQKMDDIPGENYDGTTVRGGAKVLQKKGIITEYRWAWKIRPAIDAVLNHGPVVVGTDWYAGMSVPNQDHIMHPIGSLLGGHAYLINGVDTYRGLFRIKNSWGREWGDGGHAFMSFRTFRSLLNSNGEVCLATEQTLEKYK